MTRSAPTKRDAAGTRRTTVRLRVYFLLPLTVVIAVAVGASVVDLYHGQQTDIRQGVVRLRASAVELYEDSLRDSAKALRTLMQVLDRDEPLRAALARRDRVALLERAAPMFDAMKREYGITHFYFSTPDRVNLLRVHMPERHGDTIGRFTTLQAERGGAMVHGVELGPLGLFTLRLVAPWRDAHSRQLLGYVELGMEVDHVIERIRSILGVELFVLVEKQFLRRGEWESGVRALGRTPDWERFPDVVVSQHGDRAIPEALAERLMRSGAGSLPSMMDLAFGGSAYRAAVLPLQDVDGRSVGRLALLVDVSGGVDRARRAVYIGSLAAAITGAGLFVFFWWLVGRIGRRIERYEKELAELAARDALTGLYNRRSFHSILEDEIVRARRYGHSLALLMLDIDHFKRINDAHGHLAGDAALREFAALLGRLARGVDAVCRYGGEEIAIVLPVTAPDGAARIAERIRSAVEHHAFDIGGGARLPVTVSIGLAAFPDHADTAEALVAAADGALYDAKGQGRNRVCRCEKARAGAATPRAAC